MFRHFVTSCSSILLAITLNPLFMGELVLYKEKAKHVPFWINVKMSSCFILLSNNPYFGEHGDLGDMVI